MQYSDAKEQNTFMNSFWLEKYNKHKVDKKLLLLYIKYDG